MPTQTFFNLPEEKRQVLLDLALEEFSTHPYALASISRVVVRAGIAKGSFYQYFQDKKDLFLYLLDYAARTQLATLHELQTPAEQPADFFSFLRWQMSATIQVGLTHPRLVLLMYQAFYHDLPFRDEAVACIQVTTHTAFRTLVIDAVNQGAIDPTIDVDLATFLITTILTELRRFLWPRLGLHPDKFSGENLVENLQQIDLQGVEAIYDQVIRVLRNGLSNQ